MAKTKIKKSPIEQIPLSTTNKLRQNIEVVEYNKELEWAGYYRYPELAYLKHASAEEQARVRLLIIRDWLVRIAGLKVLKEVAKTALKSIITKALGLYEDNKELPEQERWEKSAEAISPFDADLLNKLHTKQDHRNDSDKDKDL